MNRSCLAVLAHNSTSIGLAVSVVAVSTIFRQVGVSLALGPGVVGSPRGHSESGRSRHIRASNGDRARRVFYGRRHVPVPHECLDASLYLRAVNPATLEDQSRQEPPLYRVEGDLRLQNSAFGNENVFTSCHNVHWIKPFTCLVIFSLNIQSESLVSNFPELTFSIGSILPVQQIVFCQ